MRLHLHFRVLGVFAFAVALALSGSPVAQGQAADDFGPRQGSPISPEAILAATNRVRAEHGLAPLHLEHRLSLAAEDRANDMLSRHYFDHVAPDGMQPFVWVDREGYDYETVGENLAAGFATADDVVDGWMRSPSHRENILTPEFTELGLAIVPISPVSNLDAPTVVAIYGQEFPPPAHTAAKSASKTAAKAR